MKSVHQIAKECGLQWTQIQDIVKKEEMVPAAKKGRFNYFDKYQEDYIHTILYFTCLAREVVYESKMNIPEPEPKLETFEEFKARTYGKAV